MRSQGTALLLVALVGALAVWLALLPRRPAADLALAPGLANGAAPTPVAPAAPADPTAAAATAAAPTRPATALAAALRGPEAPAPTPLNRPLRVVSLGWGPLVPALLANGGATPNPESPLGALGLEVVLAHATEPIALERALAWGGAHERGADLAIVPLPVLLTSLPRLRLLDLRIVYVVAWSRGAEVLLGPTPSSLSAPSPSDTATLVGTTSSPATFLGLFALDLSGIRPTQVRLLSAGSADRPATALVGFDRRSSAGDASLPPAGVELLSTTAASRLIPYVVVAPQELLDRHRPALLSWLRGWLEGAAQLGRDGPATTARALGATPGAPEPLELLQALSWIELAGLGDNVRLMGLSGRPALTVAGLVERSWELLQAAQLVPTGSPPQTNPELVGAAVRAGLPRDRHDIGGAEPAAGPCSVTDDAAATRLAHRLGSDQRAPAGLAREVALLAEIFHGAPVRVRSPQDATGAQKLIAWSRDRFELDPPCPLLPATAADPAETQFTIEVLGAP